MKNRLLLFSLLGIIQAQVYGQCGGFAMTITGYNPHCYMFVDGSLTANVTGGNGGNIYTITDAAGTQLNLANSISANQLSDGWYYVHVIDNMACVIEDSIYIDDPDEIQIVFEPFQEASFGQENGLAIVDTVYNYVGDYSSLQFFWNPCPSGLNGIGQDSCAQLGPGDYILTVVDTNGCEKANGFTIAELPEFLFYEIGVNHNSSTGDGEVYCIAEGGTNTYAYLWTNLQTNATMNTASWTGLAVGEYTIEVTDGKGEVITETVELGYLTIDITNSKTLAVYPTFVNSGIIQFDNQSNLPISFVMYNVQGQKVYETIVNPGKIELPLTLESGTYFYQTFEDRTPIKDGKIIIAN